jgi:hypothetical protein
LKVKTTYLSTIEILRHVKQLKGSEDNIFESEIAVEKDDKQNSRISKNMDLVRDR